jgi:hypothetical protein
MSIFCSEQQSSQQKLPMKSVEGAVKLYGLFSRGRFFLSISFDTPTFVESQHITIFVAG